MLVLQLPVSDSAGKWKNSLKAIVTLTNVSDSTMWFAFRQHGICYDANFMAALSSTIFWKAWPAYPAEEGSVGFCLRRTWPQIEAPQIT